MTERFTLSDRKLSEIDNDVAIFDEKIPCTQRYVCKILNELNDENEQLKKEQDQLMSKTAETIAEHQKKVLDLIDEKMEQCTLFNDTKSIVVLSDLKKGLSE